MLGCVGLGVDDRESGTTGRGGNVAVGHFDAISGCVAKSKPFDSGRKVWLPHTPQHTHAFRQAHKLSGLLPSENK